MKNRCFLTFCSFLKSVTFINFLREIWTIRIQRWKVETLGHKLNYIRAFQSISVLHTWGNLENSIFCGLCLVGGAHHSKVDTFAVPMPCRTSLYDKNSVLVAVAQGEVALFGPLRKVRASFLKSIQAIELYIVHGVF